MEKKNKSEKVYTLLKKVPKGKVTTYKALARACGLHPREVGRILSKNPYAPQVPCHRVVRTDGSIGGYTWKGKQAPGRKAEMLKREGVEFLRGRVVKANLFKF
ncbi:MAG TPA: MGMT family protein [Nanoarchaeota archaeon]|nr:MGMT family protein [Candidatus Pacearchaeota archaeon]HIH17959.1 MGMT family protein [Nanoarchaeota archaeon]HIH33827.1 MGMT family protein [Nanoarchaeota archaeon]HIH50770.1 MGMT family protein [Nanoarchaeota archaeon]HIH65806.1 MGMT family protein [Nanoarchaeota archaeon]